MNMLTNRQQRRNFVGPRALFAVAGLVAAVVLPAQGQTFDWIAGSGSWATNSNWNPATVPNSSVHIARIAASGTYTVSIPGTYSVGALRILTSTATVASANSTTLYVHNTIDNNGVLLVNETAGSSATAVQMNTSVTADGTGTIRLNANNGNVNTAYLTYNGGGEVLTNMPTHTIAGKGRVYVNVDNRGTLSADVSGQTLELLATTKSNSGLMRGVGGGTLRVSSNLIQSPTGILRATGTGSRVDLNGVTVSNGTIEGVADGRVYAVGNSTLHNLIINGPFDIDNSIFVGSTGTIVNNGNITINRTAGANATGLAATASVVFNGTGSVTLNANPTNNNTAYLTWNGGNEVFTNGPSHTFKGTGRIYAFVTNNGVIQADSTGNRLWFNAQALTNNNIVRATNGGILEFSNTVHNTGSIVNDNSTILFSGSTLNNGVVNTANPGGITNVTSSGTFNSCTFNAPLGLINASSMQCNTSLINNSTITVNTTAGSSATFIQAISSFQLGGTGTIVLNANSGNPGTAYLTWNGGNEVITQGPNHSIVGTGRIYAIITNDGIVNANVNGSRVLLSNQSKTNRNLFTATNGGILDIACEVTQAGANNPRIVSNGGTVEFNGATINGGLIDSVASNSVVTAGATFNNVTSTGTLNIPNGQVLRTNTSLVNNGTMVVNPSSGTSATYIQLISSTAFTGNGEIWLKAHAANPGTAYLTWNGGNEVLTNGASHTIRGNGRIYTFVDNYGTIRADTNGRPLLLSNQTKTNRNVMLSTNGASMQVQCAVSQTGANPSMIADGGIIEVQNGSIDGGTLGSTNGGVVTSNAGNCFISNITLVGNVNIANGNAIVVTGPVVNNSTLRVNETSGTSATNLRINSSNTISGSGSIILNAQPGNLDTGYITYNGGNEVLTNDVGHTIAGTGRIYCRLDNNGILAPGTASNPTSVIDLRNSATLIFGPTGEYRCQIEGASADDSDRIISTRPIVLDGTLDVSRINGYVGNRGDTWTIISGLSVTGNFATVNLPNPQNGIGFRLMYYPNRVDLETICYADVNLDGGIDGADVQAFFDLWVEGDPLTDLNNDGGVDGIDVEIFFEYWSAGGC